ncbi:MAG: hypothetical protein H6609_19695 [Ignavibacteriales bacterium]|nr:hypothetical protein [Ignavibacteriales bacterium]
MNEIRLFFDNCIGTSISRSIGKVLEFHRLKPEVKHIQDFFIASITDDKWVPKIAKEKWIVVTTDKAKRYGGAKLPSICKKYNVTHILISGKLHNAPQFEKARAIISLFPQIVKGAEEPLGTRFSMRYTGEKSLMLEKK